MARPKRQKKTPSKCGRLPLSEVAPAAEERFRKSLHSAGPLRLSKACEARLAASEADLAAGRFRSGTARQLMKELLRKDSEL